MSRVDGVETVAGAADAAEVATPAVDDSALLGVYRPEGPVFVGGRGSRLVAEDGREYLDFTSGIGVNAVGYGDPGVGRAVGEQLDTGLIHASNLYRTRPAAELATALVRQTDAAGRAFFCNSGAEANEAAFKFARRWARTVGGRDKHEIVALRGSFHGRLFGTLAATDRPAYREPFEPLMPGVRFVPPGDAAAAGRAITRERTAAVIAEPVQGEGGVRPLDPAFLRTLHALADEAEAALIVDEVQCGLGRTGEFFAHTAADVAPDVVTLAKPLAGGLPMGAALVSERIASAVRAGDHATTFGGGPLVCSAALAVVRRVSDPALLAAVRAKGERVRSTLVRLEGRAGVRAVRGRGLMWGIECDRDVRAVRSRAAERGLLLLAAGPRVLRLLPPLTISEAELDAGLEVIRELVS